MKFLPNSGLVPKCELAMRYFPRASNPKRATDHLRSWIKRCKPLHAELYSGGENPREWNFSPRQVKLIYEYLGEPEIS